MTRVKQAKTTIIQGKQTTHETTEYNEVGAHEVDEILKRVDRGENEEKLREELIKTSKW